MHCRVMMVKAITIVALLLSSPIGNWQLRAESSTQRFKSLELFERLDSLEYELLSLAIRDGIQSRQMHRDSFRCVFERKAGIDLTAKDIFKDTLYKRLTCCSTYTVLCELQALKKETFDNFVERNFEDNLVEERFDIPIGYRVFDSSEDPKFQYSDSVSDAVLFGDPNIQTFICRVSRVGFDREMKQAFLHIEEVWGSLGGNAIYVLLKRTEKGWTIAGQCVDWIS